MRSAGAKTWRSSFGGNPLRQYKSTSKSKNKPWFRDYWIRILLYSYCTPVNDLLTASLRENLYSWVQPFLRSCNITWKYEVISHKKGLNIEFLQYTNINSIIYHNFNSTIIIESQMQELIKDFPPLSNSYLVSPTPHTAKVYNGWQSLIGSVARLGGLPPNWASFDRLGPEINALGG